MGREQRLRIILFVGVGLFASALGLVLYATDALRDQDLSTVDTRFSIRGDRSPPRDLVIVKVDDVSFNDLNRRWPFPRSLQGKAIDRIAADHPKAIAYDIQVSESSARNDEDIAFATSVANANRRVVLSATEVDKNGHPRILGTDDSILKDIGARAGNAQLPPDPGGVLRRVPYSEDKLKSFAVQSTEVAKGRRIDPKSFSGDGTSWIDYYGGPDTIPSISFSRVVLGHVKRGTFRNKVVVVGASAPSLQDNHATATSGDELMAGPEIQASAIDTVRRGLPLKSAPTPLDVALIVLLGMAAPLASLRLSSLKAMAVALAAAVLFAVGVQLAFNSGTVVSFLYPAIALAVSAVGALGAHYATTAFERQRVRDMFSRFVPENVVDEVLARADGIRLGGVQREGTVMFTDLRGFTSFAESLPPDRVIEVLNHYLSGMSDAILNHGGTLVAYMGDGIMAVFGAPIEQPDHADRALAAAREMLDERLPSFNDWLRSEDLGEGFRMGIGLNSGKVMSGNVGSERRMEYTAIGDTTNTAARLEGMTKGTPYQLYVADSTRSMLEEEPPDLVFVDEFEVRGRQAKVRLWSLEEEGPGETGERADSRSAAT